MSRERQQQHSEEIRNRILDIARKIVEEEGIEALSIRRITKEMDYSAGIVYHYFENKDQILQCILSDGYKRIMSAIKPIDSDLPADEILRTSIEGYIKSALKWPSEYKAIMLSSSQQILDFTSVLDETEYHKRPAMKMLASTIEAGIAEGVFNTCDVMLTAQSIWSAMFGLLIRLIIEQNVSLEHRQKLIQCQTDLLLKGLKQ